MPEERDAVSAVYADWPENAEGADTDAWPALPERSRYRRVCLIAFPMEW